MSLISHEDRNLKCTETAKEKFQELKEKCNPDVSPSDNLAIADGFTKDNVLNVGASRFSETRIVKLPDPPVGKTWSNDYPIIINLTPVNCKNDQFKPTEPPFMLEKYKLNKFCPDMFKVNVDYGAGNATITGYELDGKTRKKWGQNLTLAWRPALAIAPAAEQEEENERTQELLLQDEFDNGPANDGAPGSDPAATPAADAAAATPAADDAATPGASGASAVHATGANANDEDNSAEETKNEESSAISLKDGAKITVTFHIKGGKVVPSVDGQGPSLEELLTVTQGQGQKGGKKKKSRKHKKQKKASKKVRKTKRRKSRK